MQTVIRQLVETDIKQVEYENTAVMDVQSMMSIMTPR